MHARSLLLIALPVLAGCSFTTAHEERGSWRAIKARRLAELHAERDFDGAIARLHELAGRAAPRSTSPQDPVRVDQSEPAGPGAGIRAYRGVPQALRVSFAAGVGTVQFIAPATTLSDRTEAAFFELGVDGKADSPSGPGLRVRAFSTDDDLFSGSTFNDGLLPARATARATSITAFPHLRFAAMRGSAYEVPLRLGVAVGYLLVDHDARVDRTWLTLGPRLEAEPAIQLLGSFYNRLDLFGRVGAEVGYGIFEEEFRGGEDDDETAQWAYDVGAGLRWQRGDWRLELAYQFGQGRYSATDTALFGTSRDLRVEQQAVWVGGSVTF